MSYSQVELDALRKAYASGVLEVRYDGKFTRYDSGPELLDRIRVIEADIARTTSGQPVHVAGYAAYRRD